ncbi:hypothetical protein Moror_6668 [Moniliophthora roreri MCA 2997]|uniref:Uncharacterized protein n=1 Tax=Moniliophthora roreri (strain MCA 2997) TaxID=1381753 RepID=V2XV97_MONRO|nr:hypothetical protein Moror_6668 [Moniliophthora roreri MCA 2997]
MEQDSNMFFALHTAKTICLYYSRSQAEEVVAQTHVRAAVTVHNTFAGGLFAMITKGVEPLFDCVGTVIPPPAASPAQSTPSTPTQLIPPPPYTRSPQTPRHFHPALPQSLRTPNRATAMSSSSPTHTPLCTTTSNHSTINSPTSSHPIINASTTDATSQSPRHRLVIGPSGRYPPARETTDSDEELWANFPLDQLVIDGLVALSQSNNWVQGGAQSSQPSHTSSSSGIQVNQNAAEVDEETEWLLALAGVGHVRLMFFRAYGFRVDRSACILQFFCGANGNMEHFIDGAQSVHPSLTVEKCTFIFHLLSLGI